MSQDYFRGDVEPAACTPRVIAFYREGVESESALAANAAVGAVVVRPLAIGDAALLAVPGATDVEQILETLRRQPGVAEAEPDRSLTLLKR